MAVFAVLSESNNAALGSKITELFGNGNNYKVNDQQWLVSADKIAKDISDELEISLGSLGKVVVLRVGDSWFGWHDKTLWEWITLKSPS